MNVYVSIYMSMCALYVWCECVSAWRVNGHVCRGCVWACVWACMSGMCVGMCMGMYGNVKE